MQYPQELIRATAGAELCATHSRLNPKPSDCVNAYDETYRGRVDLSRKVSVGEPIQKGPLLWQVPYDVKDEAGNAAVTVYRDVLVEEVNLDSIESKIRREVQRESEAEMSAAISRAIEEDRRKRGQKPVSAPSKPCPKCPPCKCDGSFDLASCSAVCAAQAESCAMDEQSIVVRLLLWLEGLFPVEFAPYILFSALLMFGTLSLRGFFGLFAQQPRRRYMYEEDRDMRNTIMHYSDYNGTAVPTPANNGSAMPAPRSSYGGADTGENIFSPRQSPLPPRHDAHPRPMQDLADSIYLSPADTIITPSKRGDGVRRRSPFSPDRY